VSVNKPQSNSPRKPTHQGNADAGAYKERQPARVDYEFERAGKSVPLPVYLAYGLNQSGRLAVLAYARLLRSINSTRCGSRMNRRSVSAIVPAHHLRCARYRSRVQNPGSETRGPALLLEFVDKIEYIRAELSRSSFTTTSSSRIAASLLSLIP
jgi:hypothetical protein